MSRRLSTTSCFPRTRGDGPMTGAIGDGDPVFPPHTRGWTRRTRPQRVVPHVSPAHAGMDPLRPPGAGCCDRFPRTRGDGPSASTLCCSSFGFPPHTRGWTEVAVQAGPEAVVSPAHAGMDPSGSNGHWTTGCFPRTRGDGPGTQSRSFLSLSFPPHTRGWTLGRSSRMTERTVSPAHAGMDPRPPAGSGRTSCFPRTRGDGPESP